MTRTTPRDRSTTTGQGPSAPQGSGPRKPPIRIELDREALAAFDKGTMLANLGVGLAAGWLASWIVGGSGLIRYGVTGLIGSFVGSYILDRLGIDLGIRNPLAARIATATIGASLVVLVARLLA